jgi:hypothetical protein
MSGGHPRLATWILTRCAPEYRRDSFIGDLVEQYDARGSWWYWRQALGAFRAHWIRRLATANDSAVPAAEYVGDLVTAIALALFAFNQVPFFAEVFLRPTPLFHFKSGDAVADTLIGAAPLGAVIVAHLVRHKTATAAPHQGNRAP